MLSQATIEEKNKQKEIWKKCISLSKYVLYSYFFLLDPEARVVQRKGKAFFLLWKFVFITVWCNRKSRNLEAEMLHLTKSVALPTKYDKARRWDLMQERL